MSISTLMDVFAQTDAEDQLAFRQNQRYVARLIRGAQAAEGAPPWQWRADGSYLITGGLGGLGLQVARWMARQGARRLILLGRAALPPRASWQQYDQATPSGQTIAAVRELESLGVAIHLAVVDIADARQVAEFLDRYRREGWPPIRGVIHAAGVLHDQVLARVEPAALTAVLRPKIAGAWLLHQALQDQPLDFFVLFSSLAAVLGSVGQAGYAAGNAFMDALAHERRTRGLCASSINWGAWAEIGMAARRGVKDQLAARGMAPLSRDQGIAALQHLMEIAAPQTTVVVVDWERWFQANPTARACPFLTNLRQDAAREAPVAGVATHALLQELHQVAPDQQQLLLSQRLQTLVAKVLRVSRDRLLPEQPLRDFGIDSIISIELKNSIEATMQVALSIAYLLQGPSVAELAGTLLTQIRSNGQLKNLSALLSEPASADQILATLQSQAAPEDDARIIQLLEQLEQLGPEEVQELLL
jgi:NAD(P)-dependent dehydrogenase (short-subunit alcohol dehydrogenase family)/acyl carrier protein